MPVGECERDQGGRTCTRSGLSAGDFLPLRLGPGLLTWLDHLKRTRFIDSWEASMLPDRPR